MVGKVLKKVSRNTKITQEILSFISKSVMDNANGPWPTFCRNPNVQIPCPNVSKCKFWTQI